MDVKRCIRCIHLLDLEFEDEEVRVYCDLGGPGPPPEERCHLVPVVERDTCIVFGRKEPDPDAEEE